MGKLVKINTSEQKYEVGEGLKKNNKYEQEAREKQIAEGRYNSGQAKSGLSRNAYDSRVRNNYRRIQDKENSKNSAFKRSAAKTRDEYDSNVRKNYTERQFKEAEEETNKNGEKYDWKYDTDKFYRYSGAMTGEINRLKAKTDALEKQVREAKTQAQYNSAYKLYQEAAAELNDAAGIYNKYVENQRDKYTSWGNSLRSEEDIKNDISRIETTIKNLENKKTMLAAGNSMAYPSNVHDSITEQNADIDAVKKLLYNKKNELEKELSVTKRKYYEDTLANAKNDSTVTVYAPEIKEQQNRADYNAMFGKNRNNDRAVSIGNATKEEKQVYSYLLQNEGEEAAREYIEYMLPTWRQREGEETAERIKGNPALIGLAALGSGTQQFGKGTVQLFNKNAVEESALDYTASEVREDLSGAGKVAFDLLQTTGNMAPSILLSMATGGAASGLGASAAAANTAGQIAGNGLMGLSAAGNAYTEAVRLGYTPNEARLYAALIGASETGMQYVLGGISKLGKGGARAVLEKIAGVDNAIGKAAKAIGNNSVGKIGLSMLSEGTEEGLQEMITPIFKAMVFDEEYTPADIEDVAYSFLLGALSAGVLESPTVISESTANRKETKQIGAAAKLEGKGFINSMVQTGLKLEENSDSYKAAEKIQEKLDKGKKITDYDVGNLWGNIVRDTKNGVKANDAANELQKNTASVETEKNIAVVNKVREAIPELQKMKPVATVKGTELPQGNKIIDRLTQFVNSIGNKVNRPGFGDVLFSRSKIKNSILGHGTGNAKIETFAAVPAVIQNGQQIDYQQNWKGRGYDTYLFAAPVDYKGSSTYVGVLVAKDPQSGRYYLHEVVDENGELIYENKESVANTSDRRDTQEGTFDTVVNTTNSTPTIPQQTESVNGKEAARSRLNSGVGNEIINEKGLPERGTANGRDSIFDGSERRNNGERAGEQTGRMDTGAGRKQALKQQREAVSLQDSINDLRLGKVSSKELGVKNGTDARYNTVIPEEAWNEPIKEAVRYLESIGYGKDNVTFVTAPIQVKQKQGTANANGAITQDGRIIIRADHVRIAPVQLAKHEIFHDAAREDPGLITEIKENIQGKYTREEFARVAEGYIKKYRGVYEVSDRYSLVGNDAIMQAMYGVNWETDIDTELQELANKIVEEIYADAYAEMGQGKKYAAEVQEIAEERNAITNKSTDTERNNGPPRGERYSFGGENAKNADFELLEKAKQMQERDIAPETIFKETGWYVGADGKWRFEIDNSGMRYDNSGTLRGEDWRNANHDYAASYKDLMNHDMTDEQRKKIGNYIRKANNNVFDEALYQTLMDEFGYDFEAFAAALEAKKESRDYDNGRVLADYIQNEELFNNYPQLRNVGLEFAKLSSGQKGYYNRETNKIVINEQLRNVPETTLIHEIQHAIQNIEDFSGGASPEYWARRDYESGDSISERLQKQYDEILNGLSKEEQNKYIRYTELEYAMEPLFTAEANTEDGRKYSRLEAEQDELYEELYPNQWFRDLLDLSRKIGNPSEEYNSLYRNTAGEIEARDAAERRTLTADERRNRMPNTGDENTVFADGSGESYEIKYDKNNKPFVEVEEDILTGIPEIDIPETLTKIVDNKFSQWVNVSGQQIGINKKTAKEWRKSKNAQSLYNTDKQKYNDKLQAFNNADELLQASKKYINEGLKHKRKDNFVSFARGTVNFKVGDNGYSADILVGITKNQAAVLYDIVDLKNIKIIEAPITTTAPINGANRRFGASINSSILNEKESVNTQKNPEERFALDTEEPKTAEDYNSRIRELMQEYRNGDIALNDYEKQMNRLLDEREEKFSDINQPAQTAQDIMDALEKAGEPSFKLPEGFNDIDEYTDYLEQRARDAERERLRNKPRKEFEGSEALKKIGVKIDGSLAEYWGVESAVEAEKASKDLDRRIDKLRVKMSEKEKQFANGIVNGIYAEEDIPDTMDAEKIEELADYLMMKRSLGDSASTLAARDLRDRIDEAVGHYLEDSGKYVKKLKGLLANPLVVNRRTIQRNINHIFGLERGKEINEFFFDPVNANEAERQRFIQKQTDDVRTFTDSKGKKRKLTKAENALVQQLIEGKAVGAEVAQMETRAAIENAGKKIKDGADFDETADSYRLNETERKLTRKYVQWLKTLDEMAKADAKIVNEAAGKFAKKFDQYYDAINDFLVMHGYSPIGFIKGYAPHMQPESTNNLLQSAFKKLGLNEDVSNLPTEIAGRTVDFKPGKNFNPYFLTRTSDVTNFNISEAFDSYIEYLSNVLYHTDDIMKIRRMSEYIRKTHSKTETSEEISRLEMLRNSTTAKKRQYLEDKGVINYADYASPATVSERFDQYLNELYGKLGTGGEFGYFATYLENYANVLANKQTFGSRGTEYQSGRQSMNVANKITRAFAVSQVAGNLSSVLNQSSQIPMIIAEAGPVNTIKALTDIATGQVRKANFVEESDYLTSKKGAQYLTSSMWEKAVSAMFKPSELMDSLVSTTAVRAAYNKALSKGMSHEEAMRYADKFGRSIMGSRDKGAKPLAFSDKGVISQMINMFQVEPAAVYDHLFTDTIATEFKTIKEQKGRAKAIAAVVTTVMNILLGSFFLNRLIEEATGGTPANFDIFGFAANFFASGHGLTSNYLIKYIIDNIWEQIAGERLFDTDKEITEEQLNGEFDTEEALSALKNDVSNDLPYFRNVSALMGWGDQTLPVPDFIGGIADIKGGETTKEKIEAAGNLLAQMLPGGRQAMKTYEGLSTMIKGGKYKNTSDGERLQYPVSDTTPNWIKAALFGYSSLNESREYWASDKKQLSVDQTNLYNSLIKQGADRYEIYNAIQEYRENDNNEDLSSYERGKANRALIRSLDITDKQKLEFYGGMKGSNGEKQVEKIQSLMDSGISFNNVMKAYDAYYKGEADDSLTSYERNKIFRDGMRELNMSDEQKIAAYTTIKGSESQYESFTALHDGGLDWNQIADIRDKYEEIDQDEEMKTGKKAVLFAQWIDEYDISETQRDLAKETMKYWQMTPAEATRYEKFTDAGIDTDSAVELYEATSSLESDAATWEKYMAIAETPISESMKVSAILSYIDKEKSAAAYANVEAVANAGITMYDYASFLRDYSECKGEDANGDGKTDAYSVAKQALVVIGNMSNLTTAQKNALALTKWKQGTINKYAPW